MSDMDGGNSGASTPPSAMEMVQEFVRSAAWSTDYGGWGSNFFQEGLSLISASKNPVGKVIFEYTCHEKHANQVNNLHGGCAATLFDYCTSCALIPNSRPGFWTYVGVSRTLNVTYIRPIPIGETVLIVCEVVHAGKKLATMSGIMKRKSDGAIMATCEHGKFNVDSPVSGNL